MLNLAILLQITTVVSLEWLLGTAIVILTIVGGAWMNMRTNMALISAKLLELEADIFNDRKAVESLKQENKELFNKIDGKLDRILEHQNEVKVQLERKEDKK